MLSQIPTEDVLMAPELISLIVGSATGFIFRYMAEKRAADQENFKRLLDANERTNKNQNEAVVRVPIDLGKTTRQTIVLVALFATMVAPFIAPLLGIPTIVEVIDSDPEWLFGLIPTTSDTTFQEINGFLYTLENRQVLLAICGFFFGSAAASNKS